MTPEQRTLWTERLQALQESIERLKMQAAEELDCHRPVGSHPIVCALAGAENLVWAIKDAMIRFPTEEDFQREPERLVERREEGT